MNGEFGLLVEWVEWKRWGIRSHW